MQQRFARWPFAVTVAFMLIGYGAFWHQTKMLLPEATFWWHLDYFVFWLLMISAQYSSSLHLLRQRHLRRIPLVTGECLGLISMFTAICVLLYLAGTLFLVDQGLSGDEFLRVFVSIPPKVHYWVATGAVLYGLTLLIYCNWFTVVHGSDGVAVLNGSVVYHGEKIRRWPFFPINYEEIPGHNDLKLNLSVSCRDGRVLVKTGLLRLYRSFEDSWTAQIRQIDREQLEMAEREWIAGYLKEQFEGRTIGEVIAWNPPPTLRTRIQTVWVSWNGRIDVSVKRASSPDVLVPQEV